MPARPLIVALALSVLGATTAAQPALDDRIRIELRINGQLVQGAYEIAKRIEGKTPEERDAIYDAAPIPVRSGQTIRLTVAVTDADGKSRDYSGSPRLKYDGFGCLTVSSLGFMTVTPVQGQPCAGQAFPQLWIIYTDTAGHDLSFNAYQFRVTNLPR